MMHILNLKRGGGKTIHCIQRSHMTGFPILCKNDNHKAFIIHKAKDIGLDIPKPLTTGEMKNLQMKERLSYGKVIVDEMPYVLEALLGISIDIGTVTTEFVNWEGRK